MKANLFSERTFRPLLWLRWLMFERERWTWKACKQDEERRERSQRLARRYKSEGYRYPNLKAHMETRDEQ
jgi:hypothetical protein